VVIPELFMDHHCMQCVCIEIVLLYWYTRPPLARLYRLLPVVRPAGRASMAPVGRPRIAKDLRIGEGQVL
jgi:hypothetical protein